MLADPRPMDQTIHSSKAGSWTVRAGGSLAPLRLLFTPAGTGTAIPYAEVAHPGIARTLVRSLARSHAEAGIPGLPDLLHRFGFQPYQGGTWRLTGPACDLMLQESADSVFRGLGLFGAARDGWDPIALVHAAHRATPRGPAPDGESAAADRAAIAAVIAEILGD